MQLMHVPRVGKIRDTSIGKPENGRPQIVVRVQVVRRVVRAVLRALERIVPRIAREPKQLLNDMPPAIRMVSYCGRILGIYSAIRNANIWQICK